MDESQFLTEIKHSFEASNCFAYKIPDTGNAFARFTVSKPFDMVAATPDDKFIAIEGKVQLDGFAWSVKHLRQTQRLGLARVSEKHKRAYVFLCWKSSRGSYELVIIPYKMIGSKRSFTQKELSDFAYKIPRNNKTGRYDLTPFFLWVKMGI